MLVTGTENQQNPDDIDLSVNPSITEKPNNAKDDDSHSFTPDDLSIQPLIDGAK